MTLTDVTMLENGMNVAVNCPACGGTFDATGGGDGTWSTIGGQLVKVAEAIVDKEPDELAELRERLRVLEERLDADAVGAELAELGVPVPAGGWNKTAATARRTLEFGTRVLDALGRVLLVYEGGQYLQRTDLISLVENVLRGR